MSKKNIAVFVSGAGSNAKSILENQPESNYNVVLLVSNNKNAKALELAYEFDLEKVILNKNDFYKTDSLNNFLQEKEIDLIVLAGFLWLIPTYLINAFPKRIINIHPALLPKYGGKGMYGMNIHKKVLQNKEKTTGITIHLVNEEYDKGEILFQKEVSIEGFQTPEKIQEAVLKVEHQYFPKVIHNYLKNV